MVIAPVSGQEVILVHAGSDALGNIAAVYNVKTGNTWNVRFVSLDQNGQFRWDRHITGNPQIFATQATTLADGTTFIVGTFENGSARQGFIRKVTATGTVTGRQIAENPWLDSLNQVVVAGGFIYVAGSTRIAQGSPTEVSTLYRLSANLLIQWKRVGDLRSTRKLRVQPTGNLVHIGASQGVGMRLVSPAGALLHSNGTEADTAYADGDVGQGGEIFTLAVRLAPGLVGNLILSRHAANGVVSWRRVLGTFDLTTPYARDLVALQAGGVVVAWREDPSVATSGRLRMSRLRSSDGGTLWNRFVLPNTRNEHIFLLRDRSDNVILARSESVGGTGPTRIVFDLTNLSGGIDWNVTYDPFGSVDRPQAFAFGNRGELFAGTMASLARYSPLSRLEAAGPIAPGGNGNLIARFAYATGATQELRLLSDRLLVPPSVQVPANQLWHMIPVTGSGATGSPGSASATYQNVIASTSVTLVPGLQSVTLSPTSVVGGTAVSVTVRLRSPAPPGGATIRLVRPSVGGFANLVIPVGLTQRTFSVATNAVPSDVTGPVRALHAGTEVSTALTVRRSNLQAILAPATFTAPGLMNVRVRLDGPAPSGGITVNLTSSSPALVPLPATLVVPAGTHERTVAVSVPRPTRTVPVTLTARVGTTIRTAVVQVQR